MVCPHGPPVYRGCSVASGTSPAGPMGREALSALWDPSNCRGGAHRPWDAGPCRQATPPVPSGNQGVWGLPSQTSSPTRPRARQSWGGQAVFLCDLEAAVPWPVSPLVGSVSGSPSLPTRTRSTGLHTPHGSPPTVTFMLKECSAHKEVCLGPRAKLRATAQM